MISIIVAVDECGGIGIKGTIPWQLPADMRHFKQKTLGHKVIMGRKTFESLMAKPLPGRENIVISRDKGFATEGVRVYSSVEVCLEQILMLPEEVFIIGGAQIYNALLERDAVDRIYLTRVHHTFEVDTVFPEADRNKWELVESSEHLADAKNKWAYTFLMYNKK